MNQSDFRKMTAVFGKLRCRVVELQANDDLEIMFVDLFIIGFFLVIAWYWYKGGSYIAAGFFMLIALGFFIPFVIICYGFIKKHLGRIW